MKVSPEAVAVVKRFEGFHKVVRKALPVTASPYVCPAGYWTIGYGHLCQQNTAPITEGEGERLLSLDLEVALGGALRASPALAGDEERLAAIVSFIFNLGAGAYQASTLRRKVNVQDWPEAGRQIRRWVHGGGRVLPGLVARREVEALMLERGSS